MCYMISCWGHFINLIFFHRNIIDLRNMEFYGFSERARALLHIQQTIKHENGNKNDARVSKTDLIYSILWWKDTGYAGFSSTSSSLVFIQFRERVEFWFHEKTVSKRQFNRFICVVMSQSQQFYAPIELISNAST